ncbi:MAG: hypothetical protein ACRD82_11150 [Blastocatellia bacterium]
MIRFEEVIIAAGSGSSRRIKYFTQSEIVKTWVRCASGQRDLASSF